MNTGSKIRKDMINDEGSQLSEKIGQLKMQAADGKFYKTDVADTEQLLRLIQSIPSKKAEPFKLWLARVGSGRIDETADPELAIDRALETYFQKIMVTIQLPKLLLPKTVCLGKHFSLPQTQEHFLFLPCSRKTCS